MYKPRLQGDKTNGMFGKKHTPEAIAKMRKAAIGRRHSKETREKLSVSLKGRVSGNQGKKWTEEHREKARISNSGVNNPMYGRKHSPATIEKIRQKRLGTKLSAEHRRKIGEKSKINHCGEDHWNWKGGITLQERIDRKLFSNTTSQAVFERDNYTCQICDQSTSDLHADHIKSWREYPELRFDMDNCRTLCRPCHYYITFRRKMAVGSKWGIRPKTKRGVTS